MTTFDTTTSASPDSPCPDISSHSFSYSADCSAFLKWSEEEDLESEEDKAIIFQSLVVTLKFQPALDASLEAKAVKFLESVDPDDEESADTFLCSFGRTIDLSLTDLIQSIVVLLSSTSQVITTATMKMLNDLIKTCSAKIRLAFFKADLVAQLIDSLNHLSLSFPKAEDIHINLTNIIRHSTWLATPYGLEQLEIEDGTEQQAVHETILTQVLAPSEKYIWDLCVNRSSIINGELCSEFMLLLAWTVEISQYYQPTMDYVLRVPVTLTIPSCLTLSENEDTIDWFLSYMVEIQQEWNEKGGETRRIMKKVQRMLRMEGIDDVIEKKMLNDKNGSFGGEIVTDSIVWNNQQGMNVQEQE
ncbi:hypothetical protein BLNAU_4806 [Blattamonas nauphoetae]|uniref:Uncharacterized protein n=1 Tax=Blattamonas nauphoetae TaxID=2049346 RepID=A0ABQ9Y913_9EUKA|nr:hypothetical protein BLNAU_4806 [Blattamonas nauphoetae]